MSTKNFNDSQKDNPVLWVEQMEKTVANVGAGIKHSTWSFGPVGLEGRNK